MAAIIVGHMLAKGIKTVGFIALIMALALWLGAVITRSVTSTVHQVVDAVGKAADGDLTVRIALRSKDEIGRMGQAINAGCPRRVKYSCTAMPAKPLSRNKRPS